MSQTRLDKVDLLAIRSLIKSLISIDSFGELLANVLENVVAQQLIKVPSVQSSSRTLTERLPKQIDSAEFTLSFESLR